MARQDFYGDLVVDLIRYELIRSDVVIHVASKVKEAIVILEQKAQQPHPADKPSPYQRLIEEKREYLAFLDETFSPVGV